MSYQTHFLCQCERLRFALVSKYKQLGLEWEIFTIKDDELLYIVEKRQKLNVATPNDFNSFDDVLAQTVNIYRSVENKLEFPTLCSLVKQNIKYNMIQKVYLARDCKNNFSDYAFWKGQVIPLGNSNLFLAMVDINGKFCENFQQVFLKIPLSFGMYYLGRYKRYNEFSSIGAKWWLYPFTPNDTNQKINNYFNNKERNIKTMVYIALNKKLPKLTF